MAGGLLGQYLLNKIVESKAKKQVSITVEQLMEVTQAYLVYIEDKSEDQNLEVQEKLETMIENIFIKF